MKIWHLWKEEGKKWRWVGRTSYRNIGLTKFQGTQSGTPQKRLPIQGPLLLGRNGQSLSFHQAHSLAVDAQGNVVSPQCHSNHNITAIPGKFKFLLSGRSELYISMAPHVRSLITREKCFHILSGRSFQTRILLFVKLSNKNEGKNKEILKSWIS